MKGDLETMNLILAVVVFLCWTILVAVVSINWARRSKMRFSRRPTKFQSWLWQSNADGYDEGLFEIDYERYGQWVRASIAWMTAPQKVSTAFYNVQLLGLVDARVYGKNLSDYHNSDGWICDNNGVMLRERDMILVDLWLFGAYEFIRTVEERYRGNTDSGVHQAWLKIRETAEAFRRVRIPLAKSEPARGYESDGVSAPTGCGSNGFGWSVGKDTVILQRELSDKFLQMLQTVKPGLLMSPEEREAFKFKDKTD